MRVSRGIRDRYVVGSDGFTSPDDVIPRTSSCGGAPGVSPSDGRLALEQLKYANAAFYDRVKDAMRRIADGEDREEIARDHGRIVVREACRELKAKGVPG